MWPGSSALLSTDRRPLVRTTPVGPPPSRPPPATASSDLLDPVPCFAGPLLPLDLDRHRDRLDGLVPRFGGLGGADFLDDIHALRHFAEDRVMVVEVRRRPERDEELAAVGVGTGVRHREDAGLCVAQARIELVG